MDTLMGTITSPFKLIAIAIILVAVVLVLVLGVVSFTGMTTDLLPNIELPYVVVVTAYPGASPEKVELAVTRPLESVLGLSLIHI